MSAELEALRSENERLRQELDECRQLVVQVMKAENEGRRRIAQLKVTRAHEVVEGAIARLREAMMALHPVTLEEGGLEQALGAVGRQAARQGGFEVSIEIDPEAVGVEDEVFLAVGRELLTNAARHAGASRVSVSLARDGDEVELMVSDDGAGFNPERRAEALAEGHIGLASVSQRMRSAGGTLEIQSSPAGTTARARLAVDAPA
jgi:two-component system NarL family sensor kinase